MFKPRLNPVSEPGSGSDIADADEPWPGQGSHAVDFGDWSQQRARVNPDLKAHAGDEENADHVVDHTGIEQDEDDADSDDIASPEQTESCDDAPATNVKADPSSSPLGKPRTMTRGVWSAAKQGVDLGLRYPRASLASGLSAAILGGVMILKPGHGGRDPKAEIPGPAAVAPAQTATADPKLKPAEQSSSSQGGEDPPLPSQAEKGPGTLAQTEKGSKEAVVPALDGSNSSELPLPISTPASLSDPSVAGAATDLPVDTAKPALNISPADASELPATEPVRLTAGESIVRFPHVARSRVRWHRPRLSLP